MNANDKLDLTTAAMPAHADARAAEPGAAPARHEHSPVHPVDSAATRAVLIPEVRPGEDIFGYIERTVGGFDQTLYQRIIGAANEYKEGDARIGVAAANAQSREHARQLLAHTRISDLQAHPLYMDGQYQLILGSLDSAAAAAIADWTLGQLKYYLITQPETAIKSILPGLASDIIGCVVKLMSNQELIEIGRKVFHPLPGSQIGAKGYMGARIQPNSPTDHPDDIRWQVFDGWSYAVGDVVLGTNPVSSLPESVAAVEHALKDILDTFGLSEIMPHCVLAHIDVQAEVERRYPGSTALWFQSLGSSEGANGTFDLTMEGLISHAASRIGQYALYFETGQGADATNGHAYGFDMVVHESRKYGLARVLTHEVAKAQVAAGRAPAPWVHVNDVAGFIGPEVFRSREQLVRCCLEDIVMGKLHGLTIGLDICSTLHMDVTLDDLDWCIQEIMPANPAYLMALPTKNDPMLSYLTTAFQDHVRVRERFGYKVNDAMWAFFQRLGVIDQHGQPTEHFGNPAWVYLHYCRAKGDIRPNDDILREAAQEIAKVRGRGVFIAEGHGAHPWDMDPALDAEIHRLYEDAKESIWTEWDPRFVARIPDHLWLSTPSLDREDYILHPPSGERLDDAGIAAVTALRREHGSQWNVQIVISDGLNAHALMDDGHLLPYLEALHTELHEAGFLAAPKHIVLSRGRVRAGYQIGEHLFGDAQDEAPRAILHIVGERPGSGQHTFSVYITAPHGSEWAIPGLVDHNITRVVSGISDTALVPTHAAAVTVEILAELMSSGVGSAVSH